MNKLTRIDSAVVKKTYSAMRGSLLADPVFMAEAEKFGVEIDILDALMDNPIEDPANFLEWLPGPAQYRYAGLRVLNDSFGSVAPPQIFDSGLNIEVDDVVIIPGDVTVQGNLQIGTNSILIVLGSLTIQGNFLDRYFGYSLVAAKNVTMKNGLTAGELIAQDSILVNDRLYLYDNHFSCGAPEIRCRVLVDFERFNFFQKIEAKLRVKDWSFPEAIKALDLKSGATLPDDFRSELQVC